MTAYFCRKMFSFVLLTGLAVSFLLLGSGCKSFNPFKSKHPPLMDGRGMIPPPYSEPGTGVSVPVVPPATDDGGLGGVDIVPLEPVTDLQPDTVVELPPIPEDIETLTYEVKKGDSLWKIARAYGVSHLELAAYNKMNPNDMLAVGKILTIPPGGVFVPPEERPDIVPAPASTGGGGSTRPSPARGSRTLNDDGTTYTVKAGDNLWLIARDLNSKVSEIRAANNLANDVLQIGQVLVIPKAGTGAVAGTDRVDAGGGTEDPVGTGGGTDGVVDPDSPTPPAGTGDGGGSALPNMLDYTVTEGDTLQNIADMFSIDVNAIKTANPGVGADSDLRPNMNIRIPLN